MKQSDTLTRFTFEKLAIRGIIVHLDAAWRAAIEDRHYHPLAADQLGQFLAAGVLLSSTLKLDGSMTLQVQGNGEISLMVVEASSKRTVRGMIKSSDQIKENVDFAKLYGEGRLVITIDNEKSKDRYQGIVELQGYDLSQCLENYLVRSEQLETRLWLFTDADQATGMLIQKLPGADDDDQDAWNRITQLAATIRDQELRDLSAQEIVHRLFHEEDVRMYEGEPISFRCTCSRDRVKNMLRSLGPDEINSIIAEQNKIEVNCEFCNQYYGFDAIDAEEIFAADDTQPQPPKTRH